MTADDVAVAKPSDEICSDAVLRATPAHPWVSRGGVKLAAALDHFGGDPRFDPADRVCLDVGASTGGFTEVLLARGARLVLAVDVGHGQLHPRLRGHLRIVPLEGTDIRTLDPARLAERPDLVTIDASFVSLELVLPAALALARPPASLLALVKPQFEAGRNAVKKGVVRDPAHSRRGLRADRGGDRRARLDRDRRRPLADRWRRRQQRVLHRGTPRLKSALVLPWHRLWCGAMSSQGTLTVDPARARLRASWRTEIVETIRLALPIALTQLGQIAMMTTDLALIGQLGADAVAAVGLAHLILFFGFVLGMGLVSAVAPLAAQSFGARQPRLVRRSLRVGLWAAVLFGIPVNAVQQLWGEDILLAAGQAPETSALGRTLPRGPRLVDDSGLVLHRASQFHGRGQSAGAGAVGDAGGDPGQRGCSPMP